MSHPNGYAYINGLKTYAFKSKSDIIDFIDNKNTILVAMNAEKIMYGKKSIGSLINRNIGYPDGIGAVWALKRKGYVNTIKIPGVELWLDIVEKYEKKKSFYLVGSKQDVIDKTVKKLKVQFPEIDILNFRHGYLNSEKEKNDLIKDIRSGLYF